MDIPCKNCLVLAMCKPRVQRENHIRPLAMKCSKLAKYCQYRKSFMFCSRDKHTRALVFFGVLKQMKTTPCENCITFAICKPKAVQDNSIIPLLHECSILRRHVRPCAALVRHDNQSIYRVTKANKILLDLYSIFGIKVRSELLYRTSD